MTKSPRFETKSTAPTTLEATDVGPGFTATFLYYFTSATLLATLVAARGLNLSFGTGLPQQLGLAVGLVAGGLGGYFNRTAAISISAPPGSASLAQVNGVLDEMGYHLDEADSASVDVSLDSPLRVYVRSPLRQLLSGRVYVQQDDNQLTIASRAMHLRDLQRRLARSS